MQFYLIVATVLSSMVVGFPITPCPGTGGIGLLSVPNAIRIEGCDSSPCHVNGGESISYEVDFTVAVGIPTLTLELQSTTFGVIRTIPLPPDMSNICNGLVGSVCPVADGQTVTYSSTLPVDTDYHDGVASELRFRIHNTTETDIRIATSTVTCALVNLMIH